MIKVLKHGNLYREVMKCPNCSCEFEYSKEDTFLHTDNKISICCPECRYICKIREATEREVELLSC